MASKHAASPKEIGRVLDKVRPLARMLDVETEHLLHGMLDAFEGVFIPDRPDDAAEGYTAAYVAGWRCGLSLSRGATRHL